MLWTSEYPLHEVYRICLNLSAKTWREMRASAKDRNDYYAVMGVVKEQVRHTVSRNPPTLEELQGIINQMNYTVICALRRQERSKEEGMESEAEKELRELLRPEVVRLVAENRKSFLRQGELGKAVGVLG